MKRIKIVFLLVLSLAPFTQTYAGHKAKAGRRDKKKIHNLHRRITRLQHQLQASPVSHSTLPAESTPEGRFMRGTKALWSYTGTIAGYAGTIIGICYPIAFKMETIKWAFEVAFKLLKKLAAPKELWDMVRNITSAIPCFPLEGTSYAYLGPCYEKAIATLQAYQYGTDSVDGLHDGDVEVAKAVHHAILVVLATWLVYEAEMKLCSWIWSRFSTIWSRFSTPSRHDQEVQTDE